MHFSGVREYFTCYLKYFLISKTLLTARHFLFNINRIQYRVDINKNTLLHLFWCIFILFGQIPKFVMYTFQPVEKIVHGAIIIHQTKNSLYTNIKKLINYFFIFSNINIFKIEKKSKSRSSNLIMQNNSYFNELSNLPRLVLEPFNITLTITFNKNYLSLFDKITVFRMLQLPTSLRHTILVHTPRRQTHFVIKKKRKVNQIK